MKTTAGEKFRLRVPTDARIALAFSGGRDSVALADMLAGAGADFFAVHVEHGIRGEDSLRDADFAREFCRQRGIAFELRRVDAPAFAAEKGLTLEQAARELRYGVLRNCSPAESAISSRSRTTPTTRRKPCSCAYCAARAFAVCAA